MYLLNVSYSQSPQRSSRTFQAIAPGSSNICRTARFFSPAPKKAAWAESSW